jgi:hypothetical protein
VFERTRARLAKLRQLPAETAQSAAPRITDKLRKDATTRRGNVPSYGKFGDVPIVCAVRAGNLVVNGPDWVMKKAAEKGQPAEWAEIVRDTARGLAEKG